MHQIGDSLTRQAGQRNEAVEILLHDPQASVVRVGDFSDRINGSVQFFKCLAYRILRLRKVIAKGFDQCYHGG